MGDNRCDLNRFRPQPFFRHMVLDLTSAPLTKLQYLISHLILGICLLFTHQNYSAHRAFSKNAIKMTIGVAVDRSCTTYVYVLLHTTPSDFDVTRLGLN